MKIAQRNILVTCAWPYANGSLHVGHISALLPSDIIARYHALCGDNVLFVSGSDCHGTPISVRAEKEKKSPKEIAETYHAEFQQTFRSLYFSFDDLGLYTSTMHPLHARIVQGIFEDLYKKKLIYPKTGDSFFDKQANRFLPDRYIEGECPHCHFDQARGDQCDKCGRLLDPQQLLNPKSKITGTKPILKETEHFYLKLSALEQDLKSYIKQLNAPKNIMVFISNFLEDGLHDRAITRDLDWGIPLPKSVGSYENKRIYVWFEAVCGYLTASMTWAEEKRKDKDSWRPYWQEGLVDKAYYVYGKDNIPFHTIIWPAILLGAANRKMKYHLPDLHVSSEYLQIEGKKLSTSRNWAVWIPDLLKDFTSDAIRYSLIVFRPETADTNFSFDEFLSRFNNDFVATIANYIQRTVKLANKHGITSITKGISADAKKTFAETGELIERGGTRKALQTIIAYGAESNALLDKTAPWKEIKTNPEKAKAAIEQALVRAAQFGILLEPFMPEAAEKIRRLFGIQNKSWGECYDFKAVSELKDVLFQPIEKEIIERQKSYLQRDTT